MRFISMYLVLYNLCEYIYFYISKSITSYTLVHFCSCQKWCTFFFLFSLFIKCTYKNIINCAPNRLSCAISNTSFGEAVRTLLCCVKWIIHCTLNHTIVSTSNMSHLWCWNCIIYNLFFLFLNSVMASLKKDFPIDDNLICLNFVKLSKIFLNNQYQ